MLAVKYFVNHYRHYLLGRHFVVRTDHQALKWLFSLKEPKNRIARWIEILSAFDFEIEYRPGKKHGNADAMSRCLNPANCQCNAEEGNVLNCGPCRKCLNRSVNMESSMIKDDHKIRTVKILMDSTWNIINALKYVFLCMLIFLAFPWKVSADVMKSFGTKTLLNARNLSQQKDVNVDGRLYPKVLTVLQGGVQRLSRGWQNQRACAVTRSKWAQVFSAESIRRKQMQDPDISPVIQWLEKGKRPHGTEVCSASPASRHYWICWDSLKLKDGVLYREFYKRDGSNKYLQLIVPRSLKEEICKQMHNSLLFGHLGKKKTREKALQQYYWYGIREEINNWVDRCDMCGAVKKTPKTPRAPLGDMRVGAPMDRISTDILGPLPRTPRGNKYILVVTDHFTKWVEIFAIPDFSATTCANKILDEVIARFGCPLYIHSDQGTNYESQIFSDLCKLLEIKKTRTSPGNPRCNGQTERFNSTLLKMIKAYLKGEQTDWDIHLGCLSSAYRSTPNETTRMTPDLLMLGREVHFPAQVMFGDVGGEHSHADNIYKIRNQLEKAHDVARKHLFDKSVQQKELYDAKCLVNSYKAGDLVWYQSEAILN